MPELRKDPVIGRWVIIATERARRPGNIIDSSFRPNIADKKDCVYCKIDDKPVLTLSRDGKPTDKKWDVAVFPFANSFLEANKPYQRKGKGLYSVSHAIGVHEVVVETKEHIANMADLTQEQIKLVLTAYARRMQEIEEKTDLLFCLPFKNFGSIAGGRKIEHSRSHIMATPVNPTRVKEKLAGAQGYYETNKTCVYCDLIKKEKELKARVVLESEHFLVITPFAARFLFEIWILPKDHSCDYHKSIAGKEDDLAGVLGKVLKMFKVGLEEPAYNYYIQSAPFRREYSDINKWLTVNEDFHWHIEIMPRLTQVAGFEKGTDFYICAVPPEMTAEYLRGVEI